MNDDSAEVEYWPDILCEQEMQPVLDEVPWQRERIMMRGQWIDAPRFTAGLGDAGLSYRYAGQTKQAQPWTTHVLRLRKEVERITGQHVNFALCNYYPDGTSSLSAHSDDTRDLAPGSRIVSLSLGASRDFIFHHKYVRKQTKKVLLRHGDVLTMGGATQTFWKHSVPKRLREKKARVNITFRLLRKEK
jgi:alkylated DNA repair dioxygenase AlkB